MTTAIEPVRLQTSQMDESAQVLARAFFDDPMMMYIEPDDEARRKNLPWFMGCAVKLAQQYGEVYTTPGKVEGDAMWLVPGDNEISEERLVNVGFLEAPQVLGEAQFGRFASLLGHLDGLHHEAVPPEHWYLMVLGVDPPRQGQGVGGALISPVLARADGAGLPCYLETMKTKNVPFYQKHGFEIVVEDDFDGLHFWTMRRAPR